MDDADAVVSVDNAVEDDLQSEEEAKAETTESAAAAEEVPEDTPASLAKAEKAKKEREVCLMSTHHLRLSMIERGC